MLNEKNILHKCRLFIIGASGHGKVIEALARESACYSKITILDDNEELKHIGKVPGGKEYALEFRDCADVIVGIGNAAIRGTDTSSDLREHPGSGKSRHDGAHR